MFNYFKLQFKRLIKFFPFILIVSIVLFCSLLVILNGIMKLEDENTANKKFFVGICGDIDSPYFQVGKKAIETFDSSRFTIEFEEKTEKSAQRALERGELSAYIVIPEKFISSAMRGEILPIKYVSSAGSMGLNSIVKDEITKVIEDILVQSQKGVFGLENALYYNGHSDISDEKINELAIKYVDLIVSRSKIYKVEELGISNGLSLPQYFISGFLVLFLLIIGLPCATVFIRRDNSLNKILSSKNFSVLRQFLCEYLAFVLIYVFLIVLAMFGAFVIKIFNLVDNITLFSSTNLFTLPLMILPLVLLIAALELFLFELADNVVTGVLLQFFVTLCLCYISGCLYPIFTFPDVIQKIAIFIPTGIARIYVENCMMNNFSLVNFAGILCYTLLFILAGIFIRKYKILNK